MILRKKAEIDRLVQVKVKAIVIEPLLLYMKRMTVKKIDLLCSEQKETPRDHKEPLLALVICLENAQYVP